MNDEPLIDTRTLERKTLRDEFAMRAMQGMLHEGDAPDLSCGDDPVVAVRWNTKLAMFAYAIADAMLAERAK